MMAAASVKRRRGMHRRRRTRRGSPACRVGGRRGTHRAARCGWNASAWEAGRRARRRIGASLRRRHESLCRRVTSERSSGGRARELLCLGNARGIRSMNSRHLRRFETHLHWDGASTGARRRRHVRMHACGDRTCRAAHHDPRSDDGREDVPARTVYPARYDVVWIPNRDAAPPQKAGAHRVPP